MQLIEKLKVLADAAKYDASCASSAAPKRDSFEVVTLTLGFYKRNYIEGLFLSSGNIRDADYTTEQIVRVARSLREQHGFLDKVRPFAIVEGRGYAGPRLDSLGLRSRLGPRPDQLGLFAAHA